MNARSFLKEWTINFIKNKDMILKKLISVEHDKKCFDVIAKYKDKEQFIIVMPVIDNLEKILNKFKEDMHCGLVVFNTAKNFDIIVSNWDKLVKFRFLCIYFANPFSGSDKKWLVFPYTHDKICDKSSLKAGLNAMFSTVESLTEKDIEVRFK